jgi:hypothetical protein
MNVSEPYTLLSTEKFLSYIMFHYAAVWDLLLKICVTAKLTVKEIIAKSDVG